MAPLAGNFYGNVTRYSKHRASRVPEVSLGLAPRATIKASPISRENLGRKTERRKGYWRKRSTNLKRVHIRCCGWTFERVAD